MNRRSNKILRELILGSKQNVTELVGKYEVQERSIRTDIKELNDSLVRSELPVIQIGADGELYFDTNEKIDVHAFENFICEHTFYSYCLSKSERTAVLVMILLNAKGYITIEQLKETIGVSRTTLLRDLPEIKKWFEENKMELISQVHRGYIVNVSELDARKQILKLLEVDGDANEYETGYSLGAFWNLMIHQMDHMDIYHDIKQMIIQQEEESQSFLSDYSFFEAGIELTLAVNRIRNNQVLPSYYEKNWKELKNSSKYEFSSNLFGKIEARYDMEIPETEILYYAECLERKSYLKDKAAKSSALDIRLLIAETLYHISNSFGIDFYLDFSLYDLLVAHMRSAVFRLQTGEMLKNPLKESLLKEYPEVFEIIRKNVGSLEEYIDKEFSEDEMSFLVLYFASVLEKEKAENSKSAKVKVALVCETGRGTVQFMLAKLHTLDEMIDIVSVSSVHNAREIMNSGAQMIISTIPIECDLPCVVVQSAILNTEDILDIQRKVFELLDDTGNTMFDVQMDVVNPVQTDIQGAFYKLLSEERVMVEYEAKDWEDAVRQSGRLLVESGAVNEEYVEAMIENIKENGPYIVIWPGTALPHADCPSGVKQEAASLLKLKNPVLFNHESNDPVRYVIGISIQSAESINSALYDVMMIFGNEKIKHKLDQVMNERDLLKAICDLS